MVRRPARGCRLHSLDVPPEADFDIGVWRGSETGESWGQERPLGRGATSERLRASVRDDQQDPSGARADSMGPDGFPFTDAEHPKVARWVQPERTDLGGRQEEDGVRPVPEGLQGSQRRQSGVDLRTSKKN